MEQNGSDTQGILGFLLKDIKKCAKKFAPVKCCYCGENSATISCQRNKCKRTFHLVCGHQEKCLFTFTEQFQSFCHEHHGITDANVVGHDNCMICWGILGDHNAITSIPSCCNKGWFHVRCLRKFALTSGYLFKCPMCGNKTTEYFDLVQRRGIFVPQQDAAWELSQNAYVSLLFQYRSCDAVECLCPNGRDFSVKRMRSKWFLLKCIYCGSKGIHYHCASIRITEYVCGECTIARSQELFSQKLPSERQPANESKTDAENVIVDENVNESVPQAVSNTHVSNDAPKSPAPVQFMDVSSFSHENMQIEDSENALVSVPVLTDNIFKDRTLVFARDLPSPGTQFVESQRELRHNRLKWLLFR